MAPGRFRVNLAANLVNFLVNLAIGFWFVPYLVHNLGVAAYGLIPLATTVTSYMGLLTTALNGAVGRFLLIALDHGDHEAANRVFNTSLLGSAGLVAVLVGPAVWLASHADWFFDVPVGYTDQFVWLFYCTVGVFLLTTLTSSFSLSSYVCNRFDLSNAVSIGSNLVRIGLVVLLFSLVTPAVMHVGLALVGATLAGLIGVLVIWRRLTPVLTIRIRSFSWTTLRQLTGTGGWLVVNQVGTLLYLGIELIVVNRMLGAVAGGEYAAVMTWSTLLRSLGGVVAGIFGPTILMLYARGDLAGLTSYARTGVKFVGLAMALPVGLVCGLARPILHVWLGPEAVYLAPLMSLMTIHLSVNLGVLPLFNIQVATNKVRLPGIMTCSLGLGNLGLAILLAGPAGWGMYGVAAAGAIMLTMKNLVFTPLYAAWILQMPRGTFLRELLPIVAGAGILAAVGWAASATFSFASWPRLIGAGLVLAGAYLIATYWLLLNREEREAAIRTLRFGRRS
ncbi:MAG: oligosaccharide flippase family protein [Armatimonadetes bacterium]|nr:oligosaccharide flippase family protein [Armatimonadota bacterium]